MKKTILCHLLFLFFSLFIISESWAASPTVKASGRSNISASAADLTVLLPTGAADGDLVLIFLQAADSGLTWSEATDWIELIDANGQAVYYKQIGVAEANPTFAHSAAGNERTGASAIAITGHGDLVSFPPLVSTAGTGSSQAPLPSAVTLDGTTRDYLFIAFAGTLGAATFSAAPSGYTIDLTDLTGNIFNDNAGPNGVAGATAELASTTSGSETPGAFTTGTTRTWFGLTVAVFPTAAPAAARRVIIVD